MSIKKRQSITTFEAGMYQSINALTSVLPQDVRHWTAASRKKAQLHDRLLEAESDARAVERICVKVPNLGTEARHRAYVRVVLQRMAKGQTMDDHKSIRALHAKLLAKVRQFGNFSS
jgi:hypothetical protein